MDQGIRYLSLSRFMEDDVETVFFKEGLQRRFVADIAFDETGFCRNLVPATCAQVIENGHIMAVFQQGINEVGTDEAGPASN